MEIVPVELMPKNILKTPIDDLVGVFKMCQKMEEICKESKGIGLSAIQVGIPWKLFIVKNNDIFEFYIDCEYEPLEDAEKINVHESCLSLRKRNTMFEVQRWDKIKINGKKLNIDGKLSLIDLNNIEINDTMQSVIFQHEIDHHNHIMISDIGKELHIWNTIRK